MKTLLLLTFLGINALSASAQAAVATQSNDPGLFGDALLIVLVFTIVILLGVIIALGRSLTGLLQFKAERKNKPVKHSLSLMLLSVSTINNEATSTWLEDYFKLPIHIQLLIMVIFMELIIIFTFYYQIRLTLKALFPKEEEITSEEEKEKRSFWTMFYERWNKSFPKGQEVVVGDHDYDGIKELDNPVPPWWTIAFLGSALFGMVYLTRYHLLHMSPLQAEEFTIAQKEAAIALEKYRAEHAANVDEESVVMGDEAAIASGKSIFAANCVACHGPDGQGGVGPNMADNYYLHGGDIKSTFKVIKYGVPEKGMKAWKDDFSPVQIAQLASYVKSLVKTNPPNQKEKQGELYVESDSAPPPVSGSGADKPDSTATR